MTTVGYGDYYPISAAGCIAAVFVMIFGLILTALPVAIIGAHFTVYYEYSMRRLHKCQRNKQTGNLKDDTLEDEM